MPRDWRLRARDMLVAIEKINSYTAGMDYSVFAADEKTVDAVLHNLGIIGEAARHIPSDILDRWPEIAWAEIRGFRNIIIHRNWREAERSLI